MAKKNKKPTLKQLREKIKDEAPNVDVLPYSHNLISLYLLMINNNYGKKEANKAIKDFGLEELGWSIVN